MTLVLTDPLAQPLKTPARQGHANLALLCILDAEIEALRSRIRQRSANAAVVFSLGRADLDRQGGWLHDSLARLQTRRDALR